MRRPAASRFRAVGAGLAAMLATLAFRPQPVAAGELAAAAAELEAFGAHAGYIAATIAPCGGDAAEIDYFTGQVRVMLERIGGDAADFEVVRAAMERSRATARPTGADCRDDRAMGLASRLVELRDAVRAAAQ